MWPDRECIAWGCHEFGRLVYPAAGVRFCRFHEEAIAAVLGPVWPEYSRRQG